MSLHSESKTVRETTAWTSFPLDESLEDGIIRPTQRLGGALLVVVEFFLLCCKMISYDQSQVIAPI